MHVFRIFKAGGKMGRGSFLFLLPLRCTHQDEPPSANSFLSLKFKLLNFYIELSKESFPFFFLLFLFTLLSFIIVRDSWNIWLRGNFVALFLFFLISLREMRACWSSVSRNTGKELEEAKAKVEIAFGHGSNIVGTAEHSRYTVRISKFALRIMLEYLDKVIRITDKERLKRGGGVEGNVDLLELRGTF